MLNTRPEKHHILLLGRRLRQCVPFYVKKAKTEHNLIDDKMLERASAG